MKQKTFNASLAWLSAVISIAVTLGGISVLNGHEGGGFITGLFVVGLGVCVWFGYLTTTKRSRAVEITSSDDYRQLAEEYRRLADMAITAQEHTDLKLGEVSVRIDHLREQMESLSKILKEVE